MKPAILLTPIIPWLTLLASCSSPPRPPGVDEGRKRPANAAAAVELQACRSDLHNSRLSALDARRFAERSAAAHAATIAATAASSPAATQQDLEDLQRAVAKLQRQREPATGANGIVTVRFAYGSTRIDIPPEIARALLREAKSAPLILLRARTDGEEDLPAESRMARARATAMADYLIAAGVNPARIRATHQAIGDHAADNRSSLGRTLNRRVEIEIYRALPVSLDTDIPDNTAR
jgi:hypothetical protein